MSCRMLLMFDGVLEPLAGRVKTFQHPRLNPLLCHVDTALEGNDEDHNTQRACKDSDEVHGWVYAHRRIPKSV